MTVKIRKSPGYIDQKIKFLNQGLGGQIVIYQSSGSVPAPVVVYLSGSSFGTLNGPRLVGGIKVGTSGETWALGTYFEPAAAPPRLTPRRGIGRISSGSADADVVAFARAGWNERQVLWNVQAEPANTHTSISLIDSNNKPAGVLTDTYFTKGHVDGSGNYRTAGTIETDAGVRSSIVTVDPVSFVMSSTILLPDNLTYVNNHDMLNDSFVVAGNFASNPYVVWHYDMMTNEMSSTYLGDPAIVLPYYPANVSLDNNTDIWVFGYADTATGLSGSLWKIERSTGTIGSLFLSGVLPHDSLLSSRTAADGAACWIASTCVSPIGDPAGVNVWYVSDITQEASGTHLQIPLNHPLNTVSSTGKLEIVDMKVDASNQLWVLAQGDCWDFPVLSNGILWKVTPGIELTVSSTIIEPADPITYQSTFVRSLSLLDYLGASFPFVAGNQRVQGAGPQESRAIITLNLAEPFGTGENSSTEMTQITTAALPYVRETTANDIVMDASGPNGRVSGTEGYLGFDPSYDMYQVFWKYDVLAGPPPAGDLQTLTLRVVSGSVP